MSDLIEMLRSTNDEIDIAAADEIERLEAKLTQDPKDARCQLYKATQKWQQEAERCNAEIERLRELNDRSMSVCQHLSISGSTKGMNKVFCASCQAEYWIPSAALGDGDGR